MTESNAKPITLWPSQLPRLQRCTACIERPVDAPAVDSATEAAFYGRCAHDVIGHMAKTAAKSVPANLDTWCRDYGLPPKYERDLRFALIFWLKAWLGGEDRPGLAPYFPTLEVEKKLRFQTLEHDRPIMISGRADLYSYVPQAANPYVSIIDVKTGVDDSEDTWMPQMKAYALMAFMEHEDVETVAVSMVWLHPSNHSIETLWFRREAITEWSTQLFQTISKADPNHFCAGKWCRYCPIATQCEGRFALLRAGVSALTDAKAADALVHKPSGELQPPEAILRAWEVAKMVKQAATDFLDSLREEVKKRGGVTIEGKGQLQVCERAGRTNINAKAAWPVMTKILTVEEIGAIVSVGSTALKDAVAAKAKRGEKKQVVDQLIEDLETANALTRSRPIQVLGLKKPPKAKATKTTKKKELTDGAATK